MGQSTANDFSGSAENVVQAARIRDVHIVKSAQLQLPAPRQLPGPVSAFTDRDEQLRELNSIAFGPREPPGRARVIVLSGLGGVGKSSLALHWGQQVHDRFPDGQLYANLGGQRAGSLGAAERVLDDFLRSFNITSSRLPRGVDALAALYRTLLTDRRMLVLLDNALDADQVRPLIPPSSGCTVLVTTRSPLSALMTHDGAVRVRVEKLAESDAIALLSAVAGTQHTIAREAAADVARHCGYLPLALRIMAERAVSSDVSFAELADGLGQDSVNLDDFMAEDELESEVRAVFTSSYAQLAPESARVFRLAVLAPGVTFSAAAVAALADLSPAVARRELDRLVAHNLLERPARNRYQFHDLVRVFARERVADDDPSLAEESLNRYLWWLAASANAADEILAPLRRRIPLGPEAAGAPIPAMHSYEEALAWFDAERANLLESVESAVMSGRFEVAWRIALAAVTFYKLRNHRNDWLRASELATEAARGVGDKFAEAWSLTSLGGALVLLERREEAGPAYERSLKLARDLGDRMSEGMALGNLAERARLLGHPGDAIRLSETAIQIWKEIGDQRLEAIAIVGSAAPARLDMGQQATAIELYEEAGRLSGSTDLQTYGLAIHGLGGALKDAGQTEQARNIFQQAVQVQGRSGDIYGQAESLLELGLCEDLLGNHENADRALQLALPILARFDDPRALDIQARPASDVPPQALPSARAEDSPE